MVTISVDAMSGDHGCAEVVPAVVEVLSKCADLNVILVGQEDVLRGLLANNLLKYASQLEIQHASEVVGMGDSPASALRTKKDSSMRVAVNLVKEKRADACVSAGNTGALIGMSRFVLRMIDGIDRPAIISAVPATGDAHFYLMDLGANVDCTANHLFQFAMMGNALVQILEGISNPKVALLSNGAEEEIKGNDVVKLAADMISKHEDINYIGYVEGNDMFVGKADLVVADGFVGNVALKASEGVAKLIASHMRAEFGSSFLGKLAAVLAQGTLQRLRKKIDPGRYNGATLLGLQGIVVKSHGNAKAKSFAKALMYAKKEAEANLVEVLSSRVHELM